MFPPRLFFIYCIDVVIALLAVRFMPRTWYEKKWGSKWVILGLITAIVLHAGYYFWTYMAMFNNFQAGATDLLTFTQSLWNISHGHTPFLSHQQTHLLRDHFSLIWYGIAPVFRIWPSTEWLVLMSTVSVAATAYVIYRLAEKLLGSQLLAFAIALSYLLNPYIQISQLAAGHAESFSVLIITLNLYFMVCRNWWLFVSTLLIALGCKEDVGLYYIGIGLYIALGMRMFKRGIIIAVLSGVYSIVIVKLVMPLYGPDTQNLVMKYFSELGTSHGELLIALLTRPWKVGAVLLSWGKIFPVFYIMAQTSFLPLISGWALIPLVMALGFKSITNYPAMYHFWDHYFLHVAPFYYLSTIIAAQTIFDKNKLQKIKTALPFLGNIKMPVLAMFLIVLSLMINLENGNNPLSRKFQLSQFSISGHNRMGLEIIRGIPRDAAVLVQETLASHFCCRKNVRAISYFVPWQEQENLLADCDFVVMDLKSKFTEKQRAIFEVAAQSLESNGVFVKKYNEDGWLVFQRQQGAETYGQ